MRGSLLLGFAALGLLLAFSLASSLVGGPPRAEADDPSGKEANDLAEETNPMFANAACYVCHIPFVKEELSTVHVKEKVTCIKCHGLSAGHANDEDIGATKPDIMYKRDQVDAMCGKCHEEHDVAAAKIVVRWQERKLSTSPPVCTDCHGMHKIEEAEK